MIDPEIGITICQVTSALTNLMILVPLFAFIGKADAFAMIGAAFTDAVAMPWFAVAGFAAYFAFMLWYKGNAIKHGPWHVVQRRVLFLGPVLLLACAWTLVWH